MLRVRTAFTGITGAPYLSTMYFDGDTQAEATAAATAVYTFWYGCSSSLVADMHWAVEAEVGVVDLGTGNTTDVLNTTTDAGAGQVTSNSLPFAVQGLVRWSTGFFAGPKRLQGRTFVPGLRETTNSDGTMLASVKTDLLAAAQALVDSGTADFGVYSPTYNTFASASGTSVWDQFAVLRSRRD